MRHQARGWRHHVEATWAQAQCGSLLFLFQLQWVRVSWWRMEAVKHVFVHGVPRLGMFFAVR